MSSDQKIDELEQLRREAKWVRAKLGLPEDTPFLSGQGPTLAGAMHVLHHEAHGYRTYITAYKCNDKQGEIARQAAQLAAQEQEIERLRSAFILSHNGDLQIKWNPDGFWAYGRDRDQSLVRLAGPCDEAVDAALAALAALSPAPQPEKQA